MEAPGSSDTDASSYIVVRVWHVDLPAYPIPMKRIVGNHMSLDTASETAVRLTMLAAEDHATEALEKDEGSVEKRFKHLVASRDHGTSWVAMYDAMSPSFFYGAPLHTKYPSGVWYIVKALVPKDLAGDLAGEVYYDALASSMDGDHLYTVGSACV